MLLKPYHVYHLCILLVEVLNVWHIYCGNASCGILLVVSPPPIEEVLLCPKLSLVEMASRLVVFELRYLDFLMPLLKFIAGHWIPRD